jgi:hypothetical protein
VLNWLQYHKPIDIIDWLQRPILSTFNWYKSSISQILATAQRVQLINYLRLEAKNSPFYALDNKALKLALNNRRLNHYDVAHFFHQLDNEIASPAVYMCQ